MRPLKDFQIFDFMKGRCYEASNPTRKQCPIIVENKIITIRLYKYYYYLLSKLAKVFYGIWNAD